MKPIKTIAGEILLYFYLLQRKNITDLSLETFSFSFMRTAENKTDGVEMLDRDKTILKGEKFEKYSDADLLNSLRYLSDSLLITYQDSPTIGKFHLLQFRITAPGIDLIEGIERGEEEKREFNTTFNFAVNLNADVTVESLLKTEFGSIFKASLI